MRFGANKKFELLVCVGDSILPEFDGEVVARPGETFTLEAFNHSEETVYAAIEVDSMRTFFHEISSNSSCTIKGYEDGADLVLFKFGATKFVMSEESSSGGSSSSSALPRIQEAGKITCVVRKFVKLDTPTIEYISNQKFKSTKQLPEAFVLGKDEKKLKMKHGVCAVAGDRIPRSSLRQGQTSYTCTHKVGDFICQGTLNFRTLAAMLLTQIYPGFSTWPEITAKLFEGATAGQAERPKVPIPPDTTTTTISSSDDSDGCKAAINRQPPSNPANLVALRRSLNATLRRTKMLTKYEGMRPEVALCSLLFNDDVVAEAHGAKLMELVNKEISAEGNPRRYISNPLSDVVTPPPKTAFVALQAMSNILAVNILVYWAQSGSTAAAECAPSLFKCAWSPFPDKCFPLSCVHSQCFNALESIEVLRSTALVEIKDEPADASSTQAHAHGSGSTSVGEKRPRDELDGNESRHSKEKKIEIVDLTDD